MPRAPLKVCQTPACGALCEGRHCARHASSDNRVLARRRFDARRGTAHSRGYDRRHAKWRLLILARDPLCKIGHFCKGEAPSTVADHIIPLSQGGDWSMDNGQGACERDHDWKTATQDSRFARRRLPAGGKG
jgi:5-methylcytosine-specific restriction enzyme A